ncbi:unnamed protein product, partial [marine sediment metagenome]
MQVHQIGGLGFDSNIYLIIDEVITLIDAGTGMNFETVKRNLSKFNLTANDVKLIINTHCHYDHVGGDRDFIEASGCKVAIHELEAELLRKGDRVITLVGGDARKLPALEVDAVATDPPFGRQASTAGVQLRDLYEQALPSIASVLRRKGYACITSPRELE